MNPKTLFEQLDELHSQWTLLDQVGREMQLGRMWQQMTSAYRYLVQVYQSRGYLTPNESYYANQIGQTLMMLQSEKMKVDQALADESNTATRNPKAHDNEPISREDTLRK